MASGATLSEDLNPSSAFFIQMTPLPPSFFAVSLTSSSCLREKFPPPGMTSPLTFAPLASAASSRSLRQEAASALKSSMT